MWSNIILSFSNLVGLYPLSLTLHFNNILGSIMIILAMVSSTLYHLIETHKHGMTGIGLFNTHYSHQVFIWFDRICTNLTILYFSHLFYQKNLIWNHKLILLSILGLGLNGLSEIVFKSPKYQNQYIITHLLWHLVAYLTLGYGLSLFLNQSLIFNINNIVSLYNNLAPNLA